MNELKVISATLRNADVDVLFAENVSDFFVAYRPIWDEIQEYYNKYRTIPDIEVMAEKYPDLANIDVKGATGHYLDQLREEYLDQRTNRILMKGMKLLKEGEVPSSQTMQDIQYQLSLLNKYTGKSVETNIMDFELAEEHYEATRKRIAEMGGAGIMTGIDFIDSAYPTGWQPGDLVVVIGYTGRAKSYFTTLTSCYAYECGFTPMLVSLEMNADKIRDRVYTVMGKGLFKNSDLSMGDITESQFNQFKETYSHGRQFIVINGDGRTELTMNSIQPKFNQHRPSVITLDYAQLMYDNEGSSDMTARMRNLSSQAKKFAEANKCVVVLISSATPDGKVEDVPPNVEQVAWSKQLAYDADLAIAVHKQNNSDLVDIVCRKNRNGPLFAGTLDWDINQGIVKTAFENIGGA